MNITITASLTEEQIEILSNMKGYQPTISESKETITPEVIAEDGTITPSITITDQVVIENPISRAEFIKTQYEWLINTDASNEYIKYAKRQREEAEQVEENAIREQVKASISSSIWN